MSFFRKNKVEEVVEKQVPIKDADFYKTPVINSYSYLISKHNLKLIPSIDEKNMPYFSKGN